MFASFIAPFGGFFASGFKRGFKIKDFGDSIPGHGGVTDRFDCQVGASWRQVDAPAGGPAGVPPPVWSRDGAPPTPPWRSCLPLGLPA